MTLRRITPVLLAASVFLTGTTGAFLGSMTPAHAITSVDELSDVNRNHWAFEALRDLVEKYDVIEGYPDGTFRGDRTATRWEMAAALNALIKTIGRDLARLGAEKADKADLQTLARLQEEFRNELNALNARVGALEERAAAIEAKNDEQDNRLTLLEKTQIHGDFSMGFLSDISSQGVQSNVAGSDDRNGILDGMSAIGRLRLALDIPVKDDNPDSLIGRGDVYARLVAAFGRVAPSGGAGNNVGPNGPFSGYSRIAGDASKNNDGFLTSNIQDNVQGGNTRSSLYLESAYYKQNLKEGIPLLTDTLGIFPDEEGWETTADLYFGVVPWRFLYDKSPYRGNELTQFQNTALVNTPGIAVNYNMPMVAYQWHQGLGDSANFDMTTGLGSIDVGDVMDGLNLTYEGRLNYVTTFLGEEFTKPGSIYVGGYHIWMAGNTIGRPGAAGGVGTYVNRSAGLSASAGNSAQPRSFEDDSTNALYVGWNQEWWGGIGSFFNYMLVNKGSGNFLYSSLMQGTGRNGDFNTAFATGPTGTALTGTATNGVGVGVKQSLSGGLHIPMSALAPGWRDDDVLGVGYALIDLHEQGINDVSRTAAGLREDIDGPTDGAEHILETYYKYQFTDSISIVPSVQFIFNRLGLKENNFTTVLGLRTNFLF